VIEVSEDPHKPLRQDIHLLGTLLGETLAAIEGRELLQIVEHVRALAKDARGGGAAAFEQLTSELSSMPVELSLPVARAFAHFLNLANIAEQHHRGRRRRAYRRDPNASPQRGSCEEAFGRLLASGITPDQLHKSVTALRIELVLTAHPTEIARRTLVAKYNRIAALLGQRDRTDLTPAERDDVITALHREILAAWATKEIRDRKPTPVDEVRSGPCCSSNHYGTSCRRTCAISIARSQRRRDADSQSMPHRFDLAPGSAAIATATRTSRRK
jgi:phosphoenolpyruvate carboxylase